MISNHSTAAWELCDELWERIHAILLEGTPPRHTGRKRVDWRRLINGIVYQATTGCRWNALPRRFGDDSTVHRWYLRWRQTGALERIWPLLQQSCHGLGALASSDR